MSKIRLVVADVDGTLVTPDKELTERARRAVLALRAAGVAFAITSGRPPRGLSMLVGPLGLTTPIAAFPVVPSFDDLHEGIVKIVGVGDDLQAVARCETDVRRQFGDHVSAARSQPYYLDVTHPNANKGAVLRRLSDLLKVPTELIATIGDMPNDVLMFALSGLSIAMGNASPDVQRTARRVTGSNAEDGFAEAVEKYVLADSGPLRGTGGRA